MADERERIEITTIHEWRDWLEENFDQKDPVWLITWKEHCGDAYIPYDLLVNTALSFGWVDSLQRRVDDNRTKLLVEPISKGSPWSAANKARVQRLIEDDHIMQPGLDKVEEAKKDGSWVLFDDIEKGVEPLDFKQALKNKPGANQYWSKFPQQVRKNILWWIKSAKKAETRKKRIEKAVNEAASNRMVNHLN